MRSIRLLLADLCLRAAFRLGKKYWSTDTIVWFGAMCGTIARDI